MKVQLERFNSALSRASYNLAKLFSICNFFYFLLKISWDLEERRMAIAVNSSVLTYIFCNKESEKFVLCKSISQSEATSIVYSGPIESGYVKINF